MVLERILNIMDAESDTLVSSWIHLVRENENIHYYKKLDSETLAARCNYIYKQLKLWLDWQVTSAEIASVFWKMGAERKDQGHPLSEVLYATILARRNLYMNTLERIAEEDGVSMKEVVAFTGRITYFFDKVCYFMAKGYEGQDVPENEDDADLEDILAAFRAGTTLSK